MTRRVPSRRARRLQIEPLEGRSLLAADSLAAGASASAMWYRPPGETAPVALDYVTEGYQWPQPGGPGTPLTISYSYSNLLDGGLLGGLTELQLRSAVEEALELWASYAPLHFVEQSDSGPSPGDIEYPVGSFPQIRIGHHFIDGDVGANVLAHAYYPPGNGFDDGLSGDVHFDITNRRR
jgi:hypothetical protein